MGTQVLTTKPYTCVVCDSQDVEVFIEISQVSVYCNVLWPTREAALEAPKADMRLGFCEACGHIYNYVFDPNRVDYTQNYENSLHFSPHFREYARSLAAELVERHNLYNKDIIEIGCGRGDFLKLLCNLGGNRGIGFDPSHAFDPSETRANNQITFIQDFYTKRYANYKADLICCRHVLEHVQFPREYLLTVRQAIDNRPDTHVFFEVPNVMFTLKDLGIWDLIYEHPSYFSIPSLAQIFMSSGLRVLRLDETFEGQFLCIGALPARETEASINPYLDHLKAMTPYVAAFASKYQAKLDYWRRELAKIVDNGKRAVIWGVGSKGVMFLNSLHPHHHIEFVVDISPYKQGKYVPGTGQKIVPPGYLTNYEPDVIVVMNPIYLEEIKELVASMNLSCDIAVA